MLNRRQQLGKYGENLAAKHLSKKGYRIIETNYRNRFGEIDIVAEEGGAIVFIEVRSRRSDIFGSAKESVVRAKQRKISRVALGYLKDNGKMDIRARFDVVAIRMDKVSHIEVIRNAFELSYG